MDTEDLELSDAERELQIFKECLKGVCRRRVHKEDELSKLVRDRIELQHQIKKMKEQQQLVHERCQLELVNIEHQQNEMVKESTGATDLYNELHNHHQQTIHELRQKSVIEQAAYFTNPHLSVKARQKLQQKSSRSFHRHPHKLF